MFKTVDKVITVTLSFFGIKLIKKHKIKVVRITVLTTLNHFYYLFFNSFTRIIIRNKIRNKLPRRKQRGIILSVLLKKIYLTFIYSIIIFSLIFNIVFDLLFVSIFPNSTYKITVHSKNFHPTILILLLDIF